MASCDRTFEFRLLLRTRCSGPWCPLRDVEGLEGGLQLDICVRKLGHEQISVRGLDFGGNVIDENGHCAWHGLERDWVGEHHLRVLNLQPGLHLVEGLCMIQIESVSRR